MAAENGGHGYETKLRHCHAMYTFSLVAELMCGGRLICEAGDYMYLHSAVKTAYTGWPEKSFRMALCNRVGEMNQQKSMYVMSKHLRICL